MGFIDFCIKARWWFLIVGILILLTLEIWMGLILLIFSIIGFISNYSPTRKDMYSLPSRFEYPDKVKKTDFVKCPVCKKGKIKKNKEKPEFRNCPVCNAEFKETGDLLFKLSIKNCADGDKNYSYANCNFSLNEWNTIALTGKTLRENTLEKFKEGNVPNLSGQEINSPVVLKSKEHFVWGEQSELHEPRAIRNYHGGSVRVMKGFSIHLGQAESHQEMRHIDNGYLTLTNKRLIFSGGQRSSNIDLKRIMNIIIYSDGFKVNIENRQKPQFFATNDPEFWNALLTGAVKKI